MQPISPCSHTFCHVIRSLESSYWLGRVVRILKSIPYFTHLFHTCRPPPRQAPTPPSSPIDFSINELVRKGSPTPLENPQAEKDSRFFNFIEDVRSLLAAKRTPPPHDLLDAAFLSDFTLIIRLKEHSAFLRALLLGFLYSETKKSVLGIIPVKDRVWVYFKGVEKEPFFYTPEGPRTFTWVQKGRTTHLALFSKSSTYT